MDGGPRHSVYSGLLEIHGARGEWACWFYMAISSVLGIFDLGVGSTINRDLALLSAFEGSASAQRDFLRTLE